MRVDPSAGLTDAEILSFNTVRFELEYDGAFGVGTGFLYQFESVEKSLVPVLVTNKHVLENAKNLDFYFNATGIDNRVDLNQNKIGVRICQLESNCWFGHPNSEIDLAIIPLARITDQLHKEKKSPFMVFFSRESFPKLEEWNSLTALEQVVVVGYPAGVWDSVNNLPILKRGVTATHPKINYQGKPEFLIDVAVYQGSSGSPVFLYEYKDFFLGQELNLGKDRPRLVGILSAVYHHEQQGTLKSVPIPTIKREAVPIINVPDNLGVVIKSTELDGFVPLIDRLIEEHKKKKCTIQPT